MHPGLQRIRRKRYGICEVFRLSEILSEAKLVKRMPPKKDDENQKPYSEILIMKYKGAMLVVGKQKTTSEYVQYCISAKK